MSAVAKNPTQSRSRVALDPSPRIRGRERMVPQNESGSPVSRETGRPRHRRYSILAVLDFAEEDKSGTVADWTAPPSLCASRGHQLAVVFRELVDHLLEVDFTLAIDDDTNSPVVVVLTEQDDGALEPRVTHLR